MNYTNPYMVTSPPRFQSQTYLWNGTPSEMVTPTQQPNTFNWVQGLEAVKSYPNFGGALCYLKGGRNAIEHSNPSLLRTV